MKIPEWFLNWDTQHSHACKNNCDVFYGREKELEAMHEYIVGPSQKVCRKVKMKSGKIYDGTRNEALSIFQPFVLFGAGGAGKSALLSKCARQSLKVYDYEFSIINLSYLYMI